MAKGWVVVRHHTDQHCDALGRAHGEVRNPPGVASIHPFILTQRPCATSERIARKRCVREALAASGCTKQDWIASVLGVSRQYVARCLSDRERDEFSAVHLAKLGIAGARAA